MRCPELIIRKMSQKLKESRISIHKNSFVSEKSMHQPRQSTDAKPQIKKYVSLPENSH